MLKQRIWTAVVLAPLVLAGLFLSSFELFKVLVAIVIMLGAWEWANLAGFCDCVFAYGLCGADRCADRIG